MKMRRGIVIHNPSPVVLARIRKAGRLNRLLPFQNSLVQVEQWVGLLEGMVRLLVAVLR